MYIQSLLKALQEDVQELALEVIVGHIYTLSFQPTIFNGIKGSQELDLTLRKLKDDVLKGKNTEFSLSLDGILKFKERLCVPEDSELKE